MIKKTKTACFIVPFALLAFIACTSRHLEELDSKVEENTLVNCDTLDIKYTTAVKPILAKNCYSCHGSNAPTTKFTTYAQVKSMADNGKLVGCIKQLQGFNPMPPDGKLNACDRKKIELWVQKGALEN